jgi:HprK-related kinase A
MKHQFSVKVGPVGFRVGSAWPGPIADLKHLYAAYPPPDNGIADYTVRLEPETRLRRWIRPSVAIRGDYMLPDAVPLALRHGLLAAEMGMNLQMALGQRKYLLLHAGSVERDGKVLIVTGESGAGKSTLSSLLGERGWRFMGDEFALIDPETGLAHPFPRPVSLKNKAIDVVRAECGEARLGPLMEATPKGDIRHLIPPAAAIAAMETPGKPALILFPRFGHDRAIRPMGSSEVFVRLTQASTNYVALGERGFSALTTLVTNTPVRAIDYPDTDGAMALVEQLWAELA